MKNDKKKNEVMGKVKVKGSGIEPNELALNRLAHE